MLESDNHSNESLLTVIMEEGNAALPQLGDGMRTEVESLPIAAGKTATYVGAIGALVGGWTISEIGVVVGIMVGVLGLIFGQYWAWRRDRRELAEQELKRIFEYGPNWRTMLEKAEKEAAAK